MYASPASSALMCQSPHVMHKAPPPVPLPTPAPLSTPAPFLPPHPFLLPLLSWCPQIASFIGYIFNYLDKIEKVNIGQREEAMELEEAIEAGEAEPPVMERYSAILPFAEGEKKTGSAKERIGNRRVANRRVDGEHAFRPGSRRPVRPPIRPLMPTSRPYPSRIHRRRMLIKRPTAAPQINGAVEGRAATAVTPAEGGEGVMGLLAHTGNVVLEVLKKFFLKEVEAGAAGWEMKELLEEAADSLTEVLMQQLDPDGCLQKLLCHLQERSSSSLTPEEGVLTAVFSVRRQSAQCTEDRFPRCVLSVEQLEKLLPPATPRTTSATP